MCIGSPVVRVLDCHSCVRGSNPNQGNHIIRYALNGTQFKSDESSAELVLHLCEQIECIAPSSFFKQAIAIINLIIGLFHSYTISPPPPPTG